MVRKNLLFYETNDVIHESYFMYFFIFFSIPRNLLNDITRQIVISNIVNDFVNYVCHQMASLVKRLAFGSKHPFPTATNIFPFCVLHNGPPAA